MCDFPAKELLAVNRKIARLADTMSDMEQMRVCAQFCKTVNDLRCLHEEITGCGCWYAALKEAECATSVTLT